MFTDRLSNFYGSQLTCHVPVHLETILQEITYINDNLKFLSELENGLQTVRPLLKLIMALTYSILIFAWIVSTGFMVIKVIFERRSPARQLAGIFSFMVFPFVGPFFYFLIGGLDW